MSDIDATIATLRQLQEKAQKGGANRGLQSIAAGTAIQTIESLAAENARLRAWADRLENRMREADICLCPFTKRLVGDGCSVCNPAEPEDK